MSGQKLINSKSQSIHIFPVSTLKSDDVTSKSEGAQTCDICGIPDIYQVVFQDVSRLKSDRLRSIKTDQDDLSKSICLDIDTQGRQFSSTLVFSIHSICLGHMSPQKVGEPSLPSLETLGMYILNDTNPT